MTTDVYDIAVSFAGEQREYVSAFVAACKQRGISVFYDKDMNDEWWGKNFIREQRKVYGAKTRYFVPFISTEYLAKPIPGDEFSAAMMTAVNRGDGYVLPVLYGNVQVPTDLLHPHIHYLKAEEHSPAELADRVVRRISPGQMPRGVSEVVREAMQYRTPRVASANFSKYRERDLTFDYLTEHLQAAVAHLEPMGFVGTVARSDDRLTVRIEHQGTTVYALDITKGGFGSDEQLNFVIGADRVGSGSMTSNGFATPFFDRESGQAKLRMMDFSVLSNVGSSDLAYTKEELFDALWDRIVDILER